ncbi:Ca-activated chloride channel family protein [Tangfeifania diversioriginum]|uniref:Ca-activated chloride channel family protein n=1 Tax=Tangfeifania diversioriginum TaxID=1168035 RepID=A0A1M6HYR6_9BACT|nr:VWA domain-containing protein [Tangfeifania diversioriginum]SHJ27370.1 Ca-activated chloride channel family protein [Tangfeifania diversioriginum]
MFEGLTFKNPDFFYLLLVIVPMAAWYIFRQKKNTASIQVSSTASVFKAPKTLRHYLRHLVFLLQVLAIAAFTVVLARPQSSRNWENVTTEGIDIVIALDISTSMLARDFTPDRLEAAKEVAIEFISGRQYDRMGLVVFAGEAFTQCPLTTDRAVLLNLFKDVETGLIEDGTAIGNGLATSVARLKDSDAISRVVILLTDGENNSGEIAPLTAAEIARTFGIRVYSIGVGSVGTAPYPVQTPYGTQLRDIEVKIDEEMLQEISTITDGKYFRATSNTKLEEIYEEIDQLEKSKIEVREFSRKSEEFLPFALAGILLIVLSLILRTTVFRSIP